MRCYFDNYNNGVGIWALKKKTANMNNTKYFQKLLIFMRRKIYHRAIMATW